MDADARLNWLLELAEKLDIDVRCENLGGDGGGLCLLRGRRLLFVDLDADIQSQYEDALLAMCDLPRFADFHLPPVIEEDLNRLRGDLPGRTDAV